MSIPDDIGVVHFVGIGGIGMSALAEVLDSLGYSVQGSDKSEGANVERLRAKGITVHIGHRESNLDGCSVVVASSAISADNPERLGARSRNLPLVRRAEMLAELMRFKRSIAVGGAHGKTTTTSLIGSLLESGGYDPTIINGGVLNSLGTNARVGMGEWMVAEADESDGTFLRLPADIAVVTNIDREHMDHYGTFEEICAAFRTFVENVPFYGCGVLCIDDPEVRRLSERIFDRHIITYGSSEFSDVRFDNIRPDGRASLFDIQLSDRHSDEVEVWRDIMLPMPGIYNVSNATAAITVLRRLGMDESSIRSGLASFGGVRRRFTYVGTWNGAEIFDDYGHHPSEISSVLRAARSVSSGKVIAVKQPHRYTRLSSLFDDFCGCFGDSDLVLVLPVYAAGESVSEPDSSSLVSGLVSSRHPDARLVSDFSEVAPLLRDYVSSGDVVIFLGAGDITTLANGIIEDLESL